MEMQSLEARILSRMEEPFAMGLLEERNAPMARKHARAIRRYLEAVRPAELPSPDGELYPSGAADIWHLGKPASLYNHFSSTIVFNPVLFQEKQAKYLTTAQELAVSNEILATLQNYTINPMSPKYCVGGNGYTHSILNYRKILTQGLPAYSQDIEDGFLQAKTVEQRDFYTAMRETFDSLMAFLKKCGDKVKSSGSPRLAETLEILSSRPPSSFYEALVLLNFMYFIDGCDSIGNLDAVLSPFFIRDFEAGLIDGAEVVKLLSEFFFHVNEHSGWHLILGNRDADERLTELCIKAMKFRRPNAGLKITASTGDAVWNAAFSCLADQTGNPSFYNDAAYRASAAAYAGIRPEDLDDIAYGGCTEFMVAGKSNVGSIDSGINLLEILDGIMEHIMMHDSFDGFLTEFEETVGREIRQAIAETDLNQQTKALYRPQLIRSLFIDDCLERGLEYNAGGARYNGGVINVAGIANAANSLFAIKQVFSGMIDLTREQLLALLSNDFAERKDHHHLLLQQPKFGNGKQDVDDLAREISEFAFDEILRHRCYRGYGFFIPSVIMFTTFVQEGKNIRATPDGRGNGSPICDSCGPMQGTDLEGPTSMLASAARLPQSKGLGTMVLNLRIRAGIIGDPSTREKFKQLLKSYFDMGGLQVQATVLDAEMLKLALKHPEDYGNLIIRIGGYTEYFNRLDNELQQEVIKRSEN